MVSCPINNFNTAILISSGHLPALGNALTQSPGLPTLVLSQLADILDNGPMTVLFFMVHPGSFPTIKLTYATSAAFG